ncbi:hypothetical protein OC861_005090 [Tilletia horrida]|nr:hypothetical protein OC861_005090 [Tilletia horrida]
MPPDGSAPPTPGSSAPGSPAKSSKFSWGFGRKSRTPSPNGSAFMGGDDDEDDNRGRTSPSTFVVKSVVRQPGGVSLDHKDEHGGFSQSPTNGTGPWSQQGPNGNYHNDSYKRQKSRPLMSLGVPDGGPGGGVGYGGAHSSNDGRPEAELRLAAATNAGAILSPSGRDTPSPQRSPTRPSSPGAGISAEQFKRKVRDRQNSLQNSPDGRQMSPVIEPRRAADIAAEARASSQDRQWSPNPTQHTFDNHTPGRPSFGQGGDPRVQPPAHGGSLPISIPSPNWSDRNRELPGTPGGEFDAVPRSFEDQNRGRSSSPGFAGLFKGIFGRSPKVEQSSSSPQNGIGYDDEHAWLTGHGSMGPAPYGAPSPNGSAPSSYEGGPNKFVPPAGQSFSAALPSPLRFAVAGAPAISDPVEEAARRQKRESMMQAQRIVDQERQRAIDAAVQRKPSTNDSPWNPKQVLPESSNAILSPPNRNMIDTVGRGASPVGRKPVPKLDDQEPGTMRDSNTPRKDVDSGDNALSRLEAMLTPAQKIIQETRSRQSLAAQSSAPKAVAGNPNIGPDPTRGVQTPVFAPKQLDSPSAVDKGKGRQLDPPEQRRETPVETPVRRVSKRNTLRKENRQAQTPVLASTPAQGSRQAQPLQPGTGPMPKDMSMSDALQDMMVRFYRFERYSVPLLRSMEQRLLDIERDAQIALHSDGTSTTSSRDQEMDRWVSEMTGMMKHEIGQLRAACKEIKEGRDVIANVAEGLFAQQKQPPAPAPAPAPAPVANVVPSVQTKASVESDHRRVSDMVQPGIAAAKAPQIVPMTVNASRTTENAVLADSASASARSSSEAGTSHFTLLTPATLKSLPPSEARSSSPSSVTADPGLGVRSRTEAKPVMVPVVKEAVSDAGLAAHAQRTNNISSASFQSAMPIQHTKDATIKADNVSTAPSADSRRSPSPNSAGRPRYTSALGRSLLDPTTRTRSPERASLDVPRDSRLDTRAESPDQTISEADTSRSNQSVEDRLKALLKGPTSAAAVLAASPTLTEMELENIISREVASPPVTEHLRWRSKDSSTSDSPNPTVRSETPSTPNGTSMHKESFFSDSTFNTTRATPPLSSSPDKTTGVFGLAPNRHLKSSSSSSIAQANATTASPSASAGSPKKSILRNPSPTRLIVASTQPVMQSPSRRATSPAESPGVPSDRADNIKTSTHASDTLRARAESYLKASTEPGEGLTTRPGAWAASRFTETGSVIRSPGSSHTLDSSKDGFKAGGGIDGLPGGGSKMRSSTWLASDSTNFNLNTSNRTGAWATGQYRRTSNSNAVGANATLKEKLAFFDAAR